MSMLVRLASVAALLAVGFAHYAPAENASANITEYGEALARINTYRLWLGLEPLQMNASLMQAAQSHADYYELNSSTMAGMGLHNQVEGNPGFTGATMSDRARAFGYEGSINENIGLSGSLLATVDWSIATINHRLTLIDPRYTDIGFGTINNGGTRIEVIKLGAPSWSHEFEPEWVAWPTDGTTGIGLEYLGSAPSPFRSVPYPVGYPITLKYGGPGEVHFHHAELRANGSVVTALTGKGSGWLTRDTMMILAIDPLQPNTHYEVVVEATAGGNDVTLSWSFQTGSDNGSLPELPGFDNGTWSPSGTQVGEFTLELPENLSQLDPSVQDTWSSADGPVHQGWVDRSWLWGPDALVTKWEPYAGATGGEREVSYFDKSRMEINDPEGDRSSEWFITNGLLVRDLIRGAIQVGEHDFEPHQPADIAIAGDNLEYNPDAPTYASLAEHSAVTNGHREPDRTGETVTAALHQDGTLYEGVDLPADVTYAYYDDVTGFNVADVFWDWISNETHYDWIYAVGHPIADPYWVRTRVDGEEQWVLAQAFQRRLLTYTPSNAEDWQLEMGNVGRHYYAWRYGEAPPQ
jgi:uncharacterized protein YkwD